MREIVNIVKLSTGSHDYSGNHQDMILSYVVLKNSPMLRIRRLMFISSLELGKGSKTVLKIVFITWGRGATLA